MFLLLSVQRSRGTHANRSHLEAPMAVEHNKHQSADEQLFGFTICLTLM